MRPSLDLIPRRRLEYEPPGNCHDFGIGEAFAALGALSTVGGTILQASAASDQADYQQKVLNADALAQRQKANEDAAAAERAQITQNRRTELAQSKAQALGAASGTDASSPDIINTEAQIQQQGDYNALSALYEGQSKARTDTYQADIDLFKARRVKQALPGQIGGTVLSGLSSFGKLFTPGRNYYGGL